MANFGILQGIKPEQIIGQIAPSASGGGDDIGELLGGLKGLIGGFGGNPASGGGPTPQTATQVPPQASQQGYINQPTFGSNFNQPAKQQSHIQSALNQADPYKQAQQYLGLNEFDPTLKTYLNRANPKLDPSITPWCAGFVGSVLQSSGLKGTDSLMAKSYLNFGTATDKPKQGDLVVLNRGNNPQFGHVGFFSGYDEQGNIKVLGGNQGNSVSVKAFSPKQLAGFRSIPSGQQVRQYAHNNGIQSPDQMMHLPKQYNTVMSNSKGITPGFLSEMQGIEQDVFNNITTRRNENNSPDNRHVDRASINTPYPLNDISSSSGPQHSAGHSYFPGFHTAAEITEAQATMAGIAHIESGGSKNPYRLQSKPTRGDRAYGKYQIMGANIPSWSKAATGKAYTPEEFMANPEIQERTAAYWISKNLKKYGNPDDAFSVWFSGRPVNKAGNAKDVYGTSVPQYIRKARQGYLQYKNANQTPSQGTPTFQQTLNTNTTPILPQNQQYPTYKPSTQYPKAAGPAQSSPLMMAMNQTNAPSEQQPQASEDGINWGLLSALLSGSQNV